MAFDLGTLVAYLGIDTSGMDEGTAKAESKLGGFAKKAAGITTAAGVAVGAAFMTSLHANMDFEEEQDRVAASLGLTSKQAAESSKAASKVFAGNWGESLADTSTAVEEVMGNIKGMRNASADDLTAMTGHAFDFAKAMGIEVGQATTVVGSMLQNGLAKNGTDAFDMLTKAAQGVPTELRGDLFDLMHEYGPQLQQMGMDGSQALAMLSNAAKSGGSWGMDKNFDALKEFTILATDGSKSTSDAMKSLGLDAAKMSNDVLAGGDRATGATQAVVKALQSVKDPSQQAQLALSLFGTPLEDLSTSDIPKFLGSLAAGEKGLGKYQGAVTDMGNTLNDNANSNLASFWRQIQVGGLAIANWALPMVNKFAKYLATELGPRLTNLGATIRENVIPAVKKAGQWLADKLLPPMRKIAHQVTEQLLPALQRLWDTYKDDASAVFEAAMDAGSAIIDKLKVSLDKVIPALTEVVDWLSENRDIVLAVGAAIGSYVAVVATFTLVTKTITAVTKGWAIAQGILNAVMAMNPIGLVVLAIVALVGAFIIAYRRSDKFREIVDAVFGGLKKFGGWVASTFVGFIHKAAAAFHWITDKAGDVLGWLRSNWKTALFVLLTGPFGLAVILIRKHWDKITEKAAGAKSFIVDKFNSLVGFMTGLPSRMWDATKGMFDGVKDSFTSAFNYIIDKWNSLEFSIPAVDTHIPKVGKVGGFTLGTPDIPHLATGGLTTGPTLALVGDNPGGQEVVEPLSSAYGRLDRAYAAGKANGSQRQGSTGRFAMTLDNGAVLTGLLREIVDDALDGAQALADNGLRAGWSN